MMAIYRRLQLTNCLTIVGVVRVDLTVCASDDAMKKDAPAQIVSSEEIARWLPRGVGQLDCR